jgi:hypothetical protein
MLLVQLAVKAAAPGPDHSLTAIWLGLDVAWDLSVGAGTVLFGLALWHHPRFRPLVALCGVLVGLILLVLNIATFPTPADWSVRRARSWAGLRYMLLSVRPDACAQIQR